MLSATNNNVVITTFYKKITFYLKTCWNVVSWRINATAGLSDLDLEFVEKYPEPEE